MSFTSTVAVTNSFKVKDTNLVKTVLTKLSFNMYVNEKDNSLKGYADEDIIDDTTYVAIIEDEEEFAGEPLSDYDKVKVFSETLGNCDEVDFTPNVVSFETFIQDQLLEGECLIIKYTGTESRMAGVIDTWGGATIYTKKQVFYTSIDREIDKFLTKIAYEKY